MKDSLRRWTRVGRAGTWIAAAAVGVMLLMAVPTPAKAGGVHFSIGIGIPVYASPYPVYSYPAYAPPAYYVPPVAYPPVVVGGFSYVGKGHGHHRRHSPHHYRHRHSRHCRH